MARVAVVTWAPGGNLPPLLAAGQVMAAREHRVSVLASAATRGDAERLGLNVRRYAHAPDPDVSVEFERQAQAMMALAAGIEVARSVRDLLVETGATLAVVDCMLPAGLAAAQAAGTRTVSLVHFPYGLARGRLAAGDAWTTDLRTLDATRRTLGLAPTADALSAWEAVDLVLVTAPRWFDADAGFPAHVVHAGPLGVRVAGAAAAAGAGRVLLSFSTTVMDGQPELIQRAVYAIAEAGLDATLTLGPAADVSALRLPDRLEVVGWADHDALLSTCGAVVTHGGLGTTLRALAHGVPLVLLPLGRDQGFNAARVDELGAGIQLDARASAAAIGHAVDDVLSDPRYAAAAAELAARIAADEPDATAAQALERCGAEGGFP
jgi:UDP:flavonoid glycosyltransferase YjiC (YdhE family)